MTVRIEKTIFISYRRTNLPWALAIYQELTHHGYDVFFDYLSIPSGDFESIIVENIKARAHFVVVLTPSALERCSEPGDWLRREIETAMDEKRNIVPLMLESFDFGSPSSVKALNGKLEKLKKYNGLRLHSEYFFEGMNRLREQYLSVSLDSAILPISESTIPTTEEHQAAANEAAPVEKEQLTAQEWFEKGYEHYKHELYEEAIRCYTGALNLKPDYPLAYSLRGISFAYLGNMQKAISDCTIAINMEPQNADTYFLRAVVHNIRNNSRSKIADLSRAIKILPTDSSLYVLRGLAHYRINNLEKAIQDFSKGIDLKPNDSDIYNSRGVARIDVNDLEGALTDFDKAIQLDDRNIDAYFNKALIEERKKNYSSAITDYRKYLKFSGGERDNNQQEVEDKIRLLKSRLAKKKSTKKKSK